MNSFVIGPDSVIITNNRLGAGLPQQFQDYLQELITEIEAGRVDALDQNFPTMMVEHLQQLEPFVAEMWRRQTPTEWFNYDALHNAFEKTAQKAPPSQKHERRIHSQVRR